MSTPSLSPSSDSALYVSILNIIITCVPACFFMYTSCMAVVVALSAIVVVWCIVTDVYTRSCQHYYI